MSEFMTDFGIFFTSTLSFLSTFITWFFSTLVGELFIASVIITFLISMIAFIISAVRSY